MEKSNNILIPPEKLLIQPPIIPNPLLMEMRHHTPRPQHQNPYISPAQLIAQRIRKRLLTRFVRVVHCFTWEGGYF